MSQAEFYEACLQLKHHFDCLAPQDLGIRFTDADGCLAFVQYREAPLMHSNPTCHTGIADSEMSKDIEPLEEILDEGLDEVIPM